MTEPRVCGKKCEVYSRITGYHRPVSDWNVGKQQEFKERRMYDNMAGLRIEDLKFQAAKDKAIVESEATNNEEENTTTEDKNESSN